MNYFDDILNVYAYLQQKASETEEASRKTAEQIDRLEGSFQELNDQADDLLSGMDALLEKAYALSARLGVDTSGIDGAKAAEEMELPEPVAGKISADLQIPLPVNHDFRKDFRRLVREAREAGFTDAHPEDLLTPEEIARAQDFDRKLDEAFEEATRLRKKDVQVLFLAVAARVLFHFLVKKFQMLRMEAKRQLEQLQQETAQPQPAAPGEAAAYTLKQQERDIYADFLDETGNIPMDNIRADAPGKGASGIDAAQGVDIGSMLDSLSGSGDSLRTGRKIADRITRRFGTPCRILQHTTILEQSAPFHMEETDLFQQEDIIAYHKYLGWIMGTVNVLTDTITTFNMKSYSIQRPDAQGKCIVDDEISTVFGVLKPLFEGRGLYRESVAAAAVQEALTQGFGRASQQDVRTLFGRAMELDNKTLAVVQDTKGLLWNFSSEFAQAIGGVAGATLINTVVSAIHAMLYEESDGDLDSYSVRTSRILLYSGAIATTVNSLPAVVSKNVTQLDFAGILTTCVSWFQSNEFWIEAKTNFLVSAYKEKLDAELEKLDQYFQYQL